MTRLKIKTTQIVNSLYDHIEGKKNMSATQVNAAKILLNKTLPDLRQTELTGADGEALFEKITVERIGGTKATDS